MKNHLSGVGLTYIVFRILEDVLGSFVTSPTTSSPTTYSAASSFTSPVDLLDEFIVVVVISSL